MTLKLSKVRGKDNQFVFTYDNGTKVVAWQVDGNDVSTELLTDVVETVHPALPPTVPQYPATPGLTPLPRGWNEAIASISTNAGAEAAEAAAKAEEQRLMNMGSALAKGINLGAEDIPVFENGDLPDVNWGN